MSIIEQKNMLNLKIRILMESEHDELILQTPYAGAGILQKIQLAKDDLPKLSKVSR